MKKLLLLLAAALVAGLAIEYFLTTNRLSTPQATELTGQQAARPDEKQQLETELEQARQKTPPASPVQLAMADIPVAASPVRGTTTGNPPAPQDVLTGLKALKVAAGPGGARQ